jgi:N6-L-threonylcarbamoyladenine synthase
MQGTTLLSNVTASQDVHKAYGGVVPELASRAHQQNVLPVVDQALKKAGVTKEQLAAVAFTRGPGLMGSLLVGVNFAKGFARALNIPLIDVNHLQGHVMAHFIDEPDCDNPHPPFPFLCLLVSGGNSQIIKVNAYNDMEILGQTIDDAAGEAIDKCSKVMGLGYPGGPIIDKLARCGNPDAFQFVIFWYSHFLFNWTLNTRTFESVEMRSLVPHAELLRLAISWTASSPYLSISF